MTAAPPAPTLAVLGATGAVGSVVLTLLSERKDVWGDVRLFDDATAGQTRSVRGEDLTVHPLHEDAFAGVDVAVCALPDDAAAHWVPRAVAQGAVVVDDSAAFRDEPDVPLVVPEVNPAQVRNRPRGIIANPRCATLTVADVLGTLHSGWELTDVVLTTYHAASSVGRPGAERLFDELQAVADDRALGRLAGDVRRRLAGRLDDDSPFAAPLVFNVIPWVGGNADDGWTTEEIAIRTDLRKLLGIADLAVSATCAYVPVVTGHACSVHASFRRAVDVDEVRQALVEASGVVVVDDPELGEWPTALDTVGLDPTFVGRLRRPPDSPHTLTMFVCGDNLRKGAALNGIQVAELVAADLRGLDTP